MEIKVSDILNYLDEINLDYLYKGLKDFSIGTYASLNNLINQSISWVKTQSFYAGVNFNQYANILLVIKSDITLDEQNFNRIGYIITDNPKELFFTIMDKFFINEKNKAFISPNSVVESNDIGENVYIGHNCYIGKEVRIGNNVVIKNNISIEGNVIIGNYSTIYSGSIIGSDGFGYFQDNKGKNIKVPHYGGVRIGDNVEIGANTCIDRGTLDDTIIENNVKIDNLCHIAHNVIIKENSLVIALSMIGGSATLEKNTYIAPGAIVMNQLTIGENSLVGMGSVVTKNIDKNKVVAGVPAKVIRDK